MTDLAEAYARNGYLSPFDLLSPQEVTEILSVVRNGNKRLSGLTRAKPHLLFPTLWDLVHDPRILDRVEALLGPDIFCVGSSTIEKPAHSDQYVAWHQDVTFWGMNSTRGVTVWVALTPSLPASGCVKVIPGSHGAQQQHRDTKDDLNMLGAREEICDLPADAAAVSLELQPGQMSMHHPLIVHGSEPNSQDYDRIGFAIRYFAADSRQEGGSATLVRGRNLSGMTLETGSDLTGGKPDLMQHAQVLRRSAQVLRKAKEAHLSKGESET